MIRRALALSFVFLTIASSAVVLSAAPAGACSCAGGDDAQLFDSADAVFIAEVDRLHDARGSDGPAVAVMRVSDVFKGDVDRLQGVATPDGSAACGVDLRPGFSYVVFATTDGILDLEPDFYEVNTCGGTRRSSEGQPAFTASSSPPDDAGPPSGAAIRAQLGDPRSSLFPEVFIFGGVLAFVLGLIGWLSRKGRPAI